MKIYMAQAGLADLDAVLEIYDGVARWLSERAIRQWEYPVSSGMQEYIRTHVAQGSVYLGKLTPDAEPVGVVRVLPSDDEVWPEGGAEAVYVQGLATRPAVRGQKVGEAILDWVAEQARGRGQRWVRLDCIAANQRLREYYQGLGFAFRGEVPHPSGRLARFELEL